MSEKKIMRFYGIDTAMHMLRPNAKWEITNNVITRWDDPRPKPSMEEIYWVMEKIKEFEESIPTIWLDEDWEKITGERRMIEEAIGEPA